ncbi:hypothetical protein PT015_21890 [Candidatus Mycobacterium wuenschmannii]|uniref:Uncharacterized protein n=1 Tax=Candidatus Mycobacterium wuenschmannii TaxID=3027808 RepID=A0ABY8VWS6_9MYCO|nr:hypothetical protein [Candidatus Mycobacterium wuenschmannii]WIM87460.1 hypothetical protein PT015_21890 [Candidatus Mycobacterium wuenschmannii]
MGQELHVNTADLHAMSTRWGASVGDLHQVVAPSGLGLSCQASAAAVDAAHGEVAGFIAGLAGRIGERAAGVVTDSASYLAQEAASTSALAAIFQQVVTL